MIRPLQNRVLIKPDPPPEQSASGLALVRDAKPPEMSGEVIAVGRGPASAQKIRAAIIQRCMDLVDETAEQVPTCRLRAALLDAFARLVEEQVTISEVQPGDTALFAYTAGQKLTVDGETYLLIPEDDLSAVWTAEEAAA